MQTADRLKFQPTNLKRKGPNRWVLFINAIYAQLYMAYYERIFKIEKKILSYCVEFQNLKFLRLILRQILKKEQFILNV